MIRGEGIAVLASDKIFSMGTASCHLPVSEKYLVSQNIFLEFNFWEVKKISQEYQAKICR